MSENWQAGDMAECVFRGPWMMLDHDDIITVTGPRFGVRLTVRKVIMAKRSGRICLLFADFLDPTHPRAAGYDAKCFRKIAPPEADEFDREVIEALSRQPEQVPA